MDKELSVYIHYPFCKAKCPYCDFNSHETLHSQSKPLKYNDYKTLAELYKTEIEYYFKNILKEQKKQITTIFFGGGTPSLMSPELVFNIINSIKIILADNQYKFEPEITLEANPSSIESSNFKGFKDAGVNRISIGLQALNNNDLKTLGRVHNLEESLSAIDVAKSIFSNYSVDLIYARHNQSIDDWCKELDFAIKNIAKSHISAYSLTIEKGTKYFGMQKSGQIVTPNDEISEQFYESTNQILNQNGFEHYEISNYAKNEAYCKHNIVYWSGGDWLGIGPGAHSRLTLNDTKTNKPKRFAINNIYNPQNYYTAIKNNFNAVQQIKELQTKELASELILMNLRYKQGLDADFIKKKFNFDIFEFINQKKLSQLIQDGFLIIYNNKITPTQAGRKVLNSIINAISL